MRAGQMKYKLHLLRPVVQVNTYGEQETTYASYRTIWAERVKWAGARSEEVAEHFADQTVQYRIRDAHPVKENWRVTQLGGYTYTVVAIEPNLNKGMLTLTCTRVNP